MNVRPWLHPFPFSPLRSMRTYMCLLRSEKSLSCHVVVVVRDASVSSLLEPYWYSSVFLALSTVANIIFLVAFVSLSLSFCICNSSRHSVHFNLFACTFSYHFPDESALSRTYLFDTLQFCAPVHEFMTSTVS